MTRKDVHNQHMILKGFLLYVFASKIKFIYLSDYKDNFEREEKLKGSHSFSNNPYSLTVIINEEIDPVIIKCV